MKIANKDQNNAHKMPKTKFYRGLGKTLLIAFLALALIPVTVVSIISSCDSPWNRRSRKPCWTKPTGLRAAGIGARAGI